MMSSIADTPSTPSSPNKRRRFDDAEETHGPKCPCSCPEWRGVQVVRHDDLWFDDGNIVLRVQVAPSLESGAPAPPQLRGFRIHKSVLASRSPYFVALLQDASSVEGRAKVDGLPSFDFRDDFQDVRDLVLMLYGLLEIPQWDDDFDPMKAVAGPLKMAVKYEMKTDSRRLACILEQHWPDNYALWVRKQTLARLDREQEDDEDLCDDDTSSGPNGNWGNQTPNPCQNLYNLVGDEDDDGDDDDAVSTSSTDSQHGDSGNSDNSTAPDPVLILVFAEEHHLSTILRAAWYDVTRAYASGAVSFGEQESSGRRAFDLNALTTDQKKRLIVGRERLRDLATLKLAALTTLVRNSYGHEFGRARIRCDCSGGLRGWWDARRSNTEYLDMVRDPLGEIGRLRRVLKTHACKGAKVGSGPRRCARGWLSAKLNGLGEEIWDKLPEIFGFKVESE